MKHVYIPVAALLTFIMALNTFAQEKQDSKPSWTDMGVMYGKVFANFHYQLANTDGEKGFEIKRAYLGYKVNLGEGFSGNIKLDIGSPNDVSEYSLKKRFAYFKNAYIQYKYNNLSIQFGIADGQQFKVQEKFWGYRYIYKSFQDQYKFGPSADIGVFTKYKMNNLIFFDASLSNGEGYSTTQSDNDFKAAVGAHIKPIDKITLRLYYDSFIVSEFKQSSLSSFIGFKLDKLSFGGEYAYQWHSSFLENRNKYGYSLFGTVKPFDMIEFFARYDHLFSNILDGADTPWNLNKDGSSIITGIELSPIKTVNISLNYQDWISYAENGSDEHYLFFNLQYSF